MDSFGACSCGELRDFKAEMGKRGMKYPSATSTLVQVTHCLCMGPLRWVISACAARPAVICAFQKLKYELYLILFVADRRRKLRGRSPLQDENPDENDYIDEAMKHSDTLAMERITATMEDYESDMNNYSGPVGKGDRSRSG